MSTKASVTFYGGVGSVTGANFMFTSGDTRILVDCGMFQGRGLCDTSNNEPFAYDLSTVSALIVTHAHIDHIGRIPKLIKDGYKGPIYSTPQTKALAGPMLDDAARLIADEARNCGIPPAYAPDDVAPIFANWKEVPYYTPFTIGDVGIELKDAGHILGSSLIVCTHPESGTIVFTGDLGNSPSLLLRDTDTITDANYMIMESVYGDRNHEPEQDRTLHLEEVIERVIAQKGTLLIPAFSVERTQTLLFEINNLVEGRRIPAVPVYLDSPLAIRVTDVYRNSVALYNEATKAAMAQDDIFNFDKLSFVRSHQASQELDREPGPKIIIAGSGMSHGGRILQHERHYLSDPNSILLIVGYQAPGSIGRQLVEGAKMIDINGDKVTVKAHIETIYGYSGHRDLDGLMAFVDHTHKTLKRLFVTMGEPKTSQFFAQRVRDYIGVDAICPSVGETIELS